jgi:hypothetical protein
MAFDPHRFGLPAQQTQLPFVKKYPWRDGGSQLFAYIAGVNLGIDPNNPRFPLNPNDFSRVIVRWTGPETVANMTSAATDLYKGITLEPKFAGQTLQVVEKNAILRMPVGSRAVVNGDFVMPDKYSAFAAFDTDVIPQVFKKQWFHAAHTAITAAVNLAAGYAAGTTQILIDTISVAFAIRPGMTISINTGAVLSYYLIADVDYNVAAFLGADALITLAWPLAVAVVNNDVISTVHIASLPIFFQWDSEWYENLFSIETCVVNDASVPDADILPVVAFNAAGIAATTVAIVPSGAGGVFTHPGGARGGVGLQLGDVLATGDVVHLTAYFYDKMIRQRTIGFAQQSGGVRTAATVATTVAVELKC